MTVYNKFNFGEGTQMRDNINSRETTSGGIGTDGDL